MGTPLSSTDKSLDSLEASRIAEQKIRKDKAGNIIVGLKNYLDLDINDARDDNFSWTYELDELGKCYQDGTIEIKNLIVTGIGDILLEHRDLPRGDVRALLGVFKVKMLSSNDISYQRYLDDKKLQETL